MGYPVPVNEAERLNALHALGTLGSPALDRVCRMAQELLAAPMAAITLVDADRQFFAAKCGIDTDEVARAHSFCTYVIMHDEVFVVPDASADRVFARNPFVAGEPKVRFYAGAPLATRPGIRLGALCVIDTKPRVFSPGEVRLLAGLSRLAVDELWVHHLAQAGFVSTDASPTLGAPGLDFDVEPPLTSAQVRAARGLLNWSVQDLAAAAGVSPMTIKRLEASGNVLEVRKDSAAAVRSALMRAGVAFTYAPGLKPGIRPS